MEKEIIEKLAEIEHTRWANWQRWMHTKFIEYKDVKNSKEVVCLEREWVNRWDNQIQTNYKDLSEKEKDSDREQVYRYLPIVQDLLDKQKEDIKKMIKASGDGYWGTKAYNEGYAQAQADILKKLNK